MGLPNKLSCDVGGFSCCHNPHRFFQPEILKLLLLHAGTLGCAVCLVPQLFLLVYPHTNVGPPIPQSPPCYESSPPRPPISACPTGRHECFFFNSLFVRLPYSSIFWQFWLFFVFKFVVLLLVVWEGTVHLPMSPSWLAVSTILDPQTLFIF